MFKELPEGQTHYDKYAECAERITIDFANFYGRETNNRVEFRERVIRHLRQFFDVLQ